MSKKFVSNELQKISQDFIEIDRLYKDIFSQFKDHSNLEPFRFLLIKLLDYAQEISKSIRQTLQLKMIKVSYALLRIKLEQTIILSYLIHEDENIGLKNYFLQAAIELQKINQKNLSNSITKEFYTKLMEQFRVDIEETKKFADIAQMLKKDDYSNSVDKYDRKWTKKHLDKICEDRDKLIQDKTLSINFPLRSIYDQLYGNLSSLVHSDALIISSSFHNSMNHFNSVSILMNLSQMDILNCYEIGLYFKFDNSEKCNAIFEKQFKSYFDYLNDLSKSSNLRAEIFIDGQG